MGIENHLQGLILPLCLTLMYVRERLNPGRIFPSVSAWNKRALLFTAITVTVVMNTATIWSLWSLNHRLWSIEHYLGSLGSTALGFLILELVMYWWHRLRHEIPVLWRWVHQLHHSARRVEVLGTFYFHPLDALSFSFLSSLLLFFVLGLEPLHAAIASTLSGVLALFGHWNIRTPTWLGYFIQRPESHCLHHDEKTKPMNFCDLPLWDMVFGTFRNPTSFEGECGFNSVSELRIKDMLLGVNVNS